MIDLCLLLPPTANKRKRWTRAECEQMMKSGPLEGRYELLDGEIVSKMGHQSPHAITVARLVAYAANVFSKYRVLVHYGVDVAAEDRELNWLETDLVAYARPVQDVEDDNLVLLAVEVSDTTQADDYGPKVGLYARAGVGEYWIVDLTRRVLVAYRVPQNGEWQTRQEFTEADQIAPLSAPNAFISITDLLPPLAA